MYVEATIAQLRVKPNTSATQHGPCSVCDLELHREARMDASGKFCRLQCSRSGEINQALAKEMTKLVSISFISMQRRIRRRVSPATSPCAAFKLAADYHLRESNR